MNTLTSFLVCKLQRRQNAVFFVGLCAGISLCLFLTPILEEAPCPSPANKQQLGASNLHFSQGRSLRSQQVVQGNSEDFEPRINLAGKPKKALKVPQNIVRPRYYSSELGLRQKLFVGVMTTTSSINTRGVAINKTMAHLVDKVMFFNNGVNPPRINLTGIIGFSDSRKILKPFHVLKYIADNYLDKFDYFFLVKDESYVRAFNLTEAVKRISVSEDVHIGGFMPDKETAFCSLDGGILLSNSVMQKVVEGLDWCVRNAFSDNDDDNIGRCIVHSSGQPCASSLQGQVFRSQKVDSGFNADTDLKRLRTDSQVIFPVPDAATFYKLHKYFCQIELVELERSIASLQSSILEMHPAIGEVADNITWPVGSQPTSKPQNRFDVLQWDYFTEHHVYPESDFGSVKDLSGADREDMRHILNSSVSHMAQKYEGKLQYKRLVNGYRRYDPSRGMDYILDLAFRDMDTGLEILKRVEISKLLGKVEVVTMPYVTENSRVHLILPVEANQMADATRFIKEYSELCTTSKVICTERRDKLFLLLVLLYDPMAPGKGDNRDVFGGLKSQVQSMVQRQDGMLMAWLSVKSKGQRPPDVAIVDLALRKLPQEAMVLVCSPTMNLRQDFLNRVRMNTILHKQIFSPIPFSEYHPDIVYQESERPKELDINKKYGHYDSANYQHLSFYLKDYVAARSKVDDKFPLVRQDRDIPITDKDSQLPSLLSLFLQGSEGLNVLRAVEPCLRLWHPQQVCQPSLGPNQYLECQVSRAKGLGTRAQLAGIILQYLEEKSH
ncbi:chondroitin sulfate synthase 2 [Neocloeon triangulifer]|uniref:chondroitin sulfate synthase 2 n=1 Tax=Neocloeon triangulifer TaxID=2078957 RepID=UPI00286F7561|nr:chondroitin sulfate synthase 2 [Neocloeon triangulifer]XP_059474528.1 chondroitin sulfate synthase 2 [Neocloeon triangulifer]